jgi:hypothetical protein
MVVAGTVVVVVLCLEKGLSADTRHRHRRTDALSLLSHSLLTLFFSFLLFHRRLHSLHLIDDINGSLSSCCQSDTGRRGRGRERRPETERRGGRGCDTAGMPGKTK